MTPRQPPLERRCRPGFRHGHLVLRLYRLGIVKLTRRSPGEDDLEMKPANPRAGYRYPGEVIAHASGLRTKPVRLSPLDLSVAGPTS